MAYTFLHNPHQNIRGPRLLNACECLAKKCTIVLDTIEINIEDYSFCPLNLRRLPSVRLHDQDKMKL